RAEFLARAAEYIADGIAQNQWIEYVGEGSREELLAELVTMPGVADRLHAGGIGVTPARQFYAMYPGSDVVDAETTVAVRLADVEKAIGDGYTGFCAVSDATAVTRSPEGRDAFARFEFLADQVMAVHPVSALCGYDLNQLNDSAAELICLHPFVNRQATNFRIYAEPDAGYALTGEIDAASDELFATAVRRTWSLTDGDALVIDAQGLEFISHQQLLALDRYAHAHDRKVVLRTGQHIPTRLVGLLDLTNVTVAPPPATGG
ncbi:MAG: MEDS domain-containing protein, partial [Mycobacterium sp.]